MGQWRSWSNQMVRRAAFAAVTLLVTLGHVPTAWARGRMFVANYSGDAVTVFPRNSSGDVAPSYTILGEPGDGPHHIAVHHAGGELIVANNLAYSVAVYDLASGALKRTISGPSTGIVRPTGVAVDELHREIYVANDFANSITVYDILSSGDASPKRTILSASLSQPVGVAVDLLHDEIVVANYGSGGNSITIFDRLASGDSSPKRVIQGNRTNLNLPQGVALDLIHDEIVVANSAFTMPDPGSILAFARTDDGDVAPIRTLEGDATQLCHPIGIALDVATDELVVANSCAQSVTTYGRAASGNTTPTRTVAGALTRCPSPSRSRLLPHPGSRSRTRLRVAGSSPERRSATPSGRVREAGRCSTWCLPTVSRADSPGRWMERTRALVLCRRRRNPS